MSSPLAKAALNNNVAKVKQLLSEGADANTVPIDVLIINSNNGVDAKTYEILEALIAAGANVDAVSGPLKTPLITYAATSSSDVTITQLLLANGANTNLAKSTGETPLIAALQKSHNLKNIEALLVGKADPNVPNRRSKYPIHFAIVETRDAAIVKLLLDHGASTEVKFGDKNVIEFVRENSSVPEIRALFGLVGEAAPAAAAAAAPAVITSPGSKLSRTSAKSMARQPRCFDPISGDETNIAPMYSVFYVRQPDNTAHAYCLDAMSLNTYLKSYDYVFYRCKESTPRTSIHISKSHVEAAQIRRFDFASRVYVTNAQARKIKVGRSYILEQTGTPVGRLASHATISGGSVVSGLHCQDEEPGFMYNIRELGTTKTRLARATPGSKVAGGARRRTYRKNRTQFLA